MLSGWSEADRYDFISAGLAGYKRQCEKSDSDEVPLYRPRELKRAERKKKKDMAKYIWYPSTYSASKPSTPLLTQQKKIQVDNKRKNMG